MGFMDLIQELRKGQADSEKAARAMTLLGWMCIVGGVWNSIFPRLALVRESGLHLPEYFSQVALVGLSLIGLLFLISARGIREMQELGKRAGQTAITVLIVSLLLFTAWGM